jgi:hypothetical protein
MSELQLISKTEVVPEQRAVQVTDEVRQIKLHLAKSLLYLGQLLSEARSNNYPEMLGFSSFGDWLKDSGLDMSERQAYYLIKIVDNAQSLGITQEQLEASKMSKLKEIFTLDPATQGDRIRDLVSASQELTLEEVRHEVNSLRSEVGLEPTSWMNFRVTDSQLTAIKFAIEQAQLDYGQNVSETGDVTEASNGTLLSDVICQGYLTGRKATPPTITMELA